MIEFEDILNSWAGLFNPTEEQKRKAKIRLLTCNQCEHQKMGICTSCKCFIRAKVFSSKPCPKDKWLV